jgi:hypothetical protein
MYEALSIAMQNWALAGSFPATLSYHMNKRKTQMYCIERSIWHRQVGDPPKNHV